MKLKSVIVQQRCRLVYAMFAQAFNATALGVTTTWTGSANNGLWQSGSNWSVQVPTSGDVAINRIAGASIDLQGASVEVNRLFLWAPRTRIHNGSVTTNVIGASFSSGTAELNAPLRTNGPRLQIDGQSFTTTGQDNSFDLLGAIGVGTYSIQVLGLSAPTRFHAPILSSGTMSAFGSITLIGNGKVGAPQRLEIINSTQALGQFQTIYAGAGEDHFRDDLPVDIYSGQLRFRFLSTAAGSSEDIGTVTFAGNGNIGFTSSAAGTVRMAALERRSNATGELVFDSSLGQRLLVTNPPAATGGGAGVTERPIIPWLGFITYDKGTDPNDPSDDIGLRTLLATEHAAANWATATPFTHVRLSAASATPGPQTIGSLLFDQSATLSLGGSLHLTSGLMVSRASPVRLEGAAIVAPNELFLRGGTFDLDTEIQAPVMTVEANVILQHGGEDVQRVNLTGGRFEVASASTFAPTSIDLSGGTFVTLGHRELSSAINLSGRVVRQTVSTIFSGPTDVGISPPAGARLVLNGPLSGTGRVVQSSGEIVLNGDSKVEYLDWRVQQGTLEINGKLLRSDDDAVLNLNAPSSATRGTLAGIGYIAGDVRGLHVSPGQGNAGFGSVGQLSIDGFFNITSGFADFRVDLLAPALFDQLVVYEFITLNSGLGTDGTNLILNIPFVPAVGDRFRIVDNQGTFAIGRTFNGLTEGANIQTPTTLLTISYLGGDGNDIVLTVVPEPTVVAVATIALLVTFRRRRCQSH